MGANAQTTVPSFLAAQVLTADQMNQSARTGVPVFATTVERDAAFGGAGEKVLAEGQLCYLEDANVVQYYDGSGWATVGPSAVGLQVASFSELQASGTAGGTSVQNAQTKRVLNTTVVNTITGCTLASSVIALPAGTYTIVVTSTFLNSDHVQLRFQNTTDASTAIQGVNAFTNDGNTDAQATLAGGFTIAATKNFEVQYFLDKAKAGDGQGRNANFGFSNVFTTCLITKVA